MIEPHDDARGRQIVRTRAELKPLADEYNRLVQRLLVPRPPAEIDGLFGPVRSAAPAERVLPVFAPEEVILPEVPVVTVRNDHTDFHALGDVGFAQFYFGPDGVTVQGAVLYLRADSQFVPLRGADDYAPRLRWEKPRFEALKNWLNEHLPKP